MRSRLCKQYTFFALIFLGMCLLMMPIGSMATAADNTPESPTKPTQYSKEKAKSEKAKSDEKAENLAIVLQVNGAITPATQDYIARGLARAESSHAKLIILKLNTPGGLESTMRGICEKILASKIPVIVYIYPPGARAASAGTFIAYASHLVAMAPGTNIGAASPINLLAQTPANGESLTTAQKKAVNDEAAYIRSLATRQGKNAEWGESAVRNAASISAKEAVSANVADFVVEDDASLLKALEGKTVNVNGKSYQLTNTRDMTLQEVSPGWRFDFLSFITNPNIAYLLLLLAIYGLFFEFANPGMILPGVVGLISLLLVLYGFEVMPINYAGLTLLFVGIVFMVCEVYITSYGILGLGGLVAFVVGSIMLFDVHDPIYHVPWLLIVLMSILTLTFFFILLNLAIRSHKKAIVTGSEGLIGSTGVVLDVENEHTIVRVLGEIWEAKAPHMLQRGEHVKVTGVSGLTLHVEPITEKRNRRRGE